ncbi:MAG: molybdate ABC transporter substrate-binding protein [Caldimonas sp.]
MWKAWLMAVCLASAGPIHAQEAPTIDVPTIAAASDLKFALDEVLALYTVQTGRRARVTYGSSGNFQAQIRQGAPFDLFLSADEAFVFQLADAGLTRDRGALYATGRIVLFAPRGSPLVPDDALADLGRALQDGRVVKFAIANPEHAPYGLAAREALTAKGLWSAIYPKLVLGENVSQAAQFALSGSAQGGIFALSLALSPAFAEAGRHVVIPESLHRPLRQRMVLTRRAGMAAAALYDYLQQPVARAVLKRYGFALPGE